KIIYYQMMNDPYLSSYYNSEARATAILSISGVILSLLAIFFTASTIQFDIIVFVVFAGIVLSLFLASLLSIFAVLPVGWFEKRGLFGLEKRVHRFQLPAPGDDLTLDHFYDEVQGHYRQRGFRSRIVSRSIFFLILGLLLLVVLILLLGWRTFSTPA
ncbi:MAG: hypothetical protein ACFFBD_05190, partial [Candidatus Hodarchaeota archaeon]